LRWSHEADRLAFIDAKLPDAEGPDLARRIREANPGIPIVLVSGYFCGAAPEVLQASEARIISGFLSKPFLDAFGVKGAIFFISTTLAARSRSPRAASSSFRNHRSLRVVNSRYFVAMFAMTRQAVRV
jgi:CheY-like chemotaxis protein